MESRGPRHPKDGSRVPPLWLPAKLPSPNLPSIVGRTLKESCISANVVSIGPNPQRRTWTKSRGAPPPLRRPLLVFLFNFSLGRAY